MQVILLEKVANLGNLGDVVKVKGIGEKKFKKLQVYLKLDGKSDFEPVKKAKPAKKEKVTS